MVKLTELWKIITTRLAAKDCTPEILAKTKEIKTNYDEKILELNNVITVLNKEIDGFKKEEKTDKLETYLSNKYPKVTVYYTGRYIPNHGMISIDPRVFFTPYDSTLPKFTGTYDEIALKALRWVHKNVKYIDEKTAYGLDEFWAFAFETLTIKIGDCDDGAILLANIMLNSGIPYYRIHINKGDVKGGKHLYVSYCREIDNEFIVLDWCYWFNDLGMSKRELHRNERDYYDVDLSWNQRYIYSKAMKDNEGFAMT